MHGARNCPRHYPAKAPGGFIREKEERNWPSWGLMHNCGLRLLGMCWWEGMGRLGLDGGKSSEQYEKRRQLVGLAYWILAGGPGMALYFQFPAAGLRNVGREPAIISRLLWRYPK